MSADPVHTNSRGRNILGKIINEFKKFLGMAAYLWVMFGLLALHESNVLAKHQISYQFYGFAIVNSLILAKVMLIAEDLHLGEKFRDRPLIYPILYKAFLFAIVFICFDFAEEVLVGLIRGKTFAQSITDIGGGSPSGVFFAAIILSVGLIPFFAFREIGRVIGERELRSFIFTDGARAAFQSRMRQGPANAAQLADRAR
jgi:phosphatidylserine synthase